MLGWFRVGSRRSSCRVVSIAALLVSHSAWSQTTAPAPGTVTAPAPGTGAAPTPAATVSAAAAPAAPATPAAPAAPAAAPLPAAATPVAPPALPHTIELSPAAPASPSSPPGTPVAPAAANVPELPSFPSDGATRVRCRGSCDLALAAGRYRILIEPTRDLAGGIGVHSVSAPGGYHLTGVPRSRRGAGLALATAGIVVTAVGAGMLIGGSALDSHLTPAQERWFWGGITTFGAGVAMVPMGFMLYGRGPKLEPLEVPSAVRAPIDDPSVPLKYREPTLPDSDSTPPGTAFVDEPRWGMLMAGSLVFGVSYGIMVGAAVGAAADGHNPDRYAAGLIPLLGPMLVDRSEKTGAGFTTFVALPQATGALLALLALTGPRRVLTSDTTPSVAITPWVYKGSAGFGLVGSL